MVSIIIPIYKVENYLKKCIESIIKQTYDDLDIILVDDGSPDKCGEIADYFSLIDNRITVIHQQNQGVSSARNAGLSIAKGKYVVFVDADDYVSDNYISDLVKAFDEHSDIQLSIVNYAVNSIPNIRETTGKYSQIETAIRLFKRQSFMGYLFNKMFLLSIIKENDISFTEDAHWCEDSLFCSKYVLQIENAYYNQIIGYNYCIREDSATNLKYNEKHISVLNTYKQIITLMRQLENPELNTLIETNYVIHCINVKRMLMRSGKKNDAVNIYLQGVLRKNKKLLFENKLNFKDKVKYIACLLGISI